MGRKNHQPGPKSSLLKNLKTSGFTLSEIVVVAAILGVFILLAVLSIKPSYQIAKARDSRRMADLKKISTALEDYAGDYDCYPADIYDSGSSGCVANSGFGHYLKNIPCDPQTGQPYSYTRPDSPPCRQFVVYANLELEHDITYGLGNYALASSNVRLEPTIVTPTEGAGGGGEPEPPTSTPVPTATTFPRGNFGCLMDEGTGHLKCSLAVGLGCSPTYDMNDCYGQCQYLSNECH